MKIKKLYQLLDEISPFELQEGWDNSGLIVGSFDDEINNIYISIDLDMQMLDNIKPNSLIITHHPLIFSPIKTLNFDSYSTKILKVLIKKDISLISMHTNFDKTHLNRYVAEEVLDLKVKCDEDFICYSNINSSFDKFYNKISKKLGLDYKKVVKCHNKIEKIALVTGSGMSLISKIDADCFLTGDIKYHDAMEAKIRGISLIDIGHYESEKYFAPAIMACLEENLKKNQLKAIITSSKNPFDYK